MHKIVITASTFVAATLGGCALPPQATGVQVQPAPAAARPAPAAAPVATASSIKVEVEVSKAATGPCPISAKVTEDGKVVQYDLSFGHRGEERGLLMIDKAGKVVRAEGIRSLRGVNDCRLLRSYLIGPNAVGILGKFGLEHCAPQIVAALRKRLGA